MLVLCKERGGDVVRQVRLLDRSVSHLFGVYGKLKTVPNFLPKQDDLLFLFHPGNPAVEVDDVGVVVMDLLETGGKGRVHVTFWDGKLRGREELCRKIADGWLYQFDLAYVYTSIPEASRTVIAFCKRVGFVEVQREDGWVHLLYTTEHYLHGANSEGGQ